MRAVSSIKVADEVWIATALLHREHPDREGFSVREILDRVIQENLVGTLRPGVAVHAYLHCVANLPPRDARYRMLLATPDGQRRLFRPGDAYHPHREGGKTKPAPEAVPQAYRYLLEWYEREYCSAKKPLLGLLREAHPLLQIIGAGASGRADVAERHDRYLAEGGGGEG